MGVRKVRDLLFRKAQQGRAEITQESQLQDGTRWKVMYNDDTLLAEANRLKMPWGVMFTVEKLWSPGNSKFRDVCKIEVRVDSAKAGEMVESRKGLCFNVMLLVIMVAMLSAMILYSGGKGPCIIDGATGQPVTDSQ